MNDKVSLRISELAKEVGCGVTVRQLRHLTDAGAIPVARLGEGCHRRYERRHLDLIRGVLRKAGLISGSEEK